MQQSNERLASLLKASEELQQAGNEAAVYSALLSSVSSPLGITLGLYRFDVGALEAVGASPVSDDWMSAAHLLTASGDKYVQSNGLAGWLLISNNETVGALIAKAGGAALDDSFMLALARMVALVLARTQLAAHLADARAHALTEELKSALLSSVSHDLRSPLTVINASAASLLTFGDSFDRETMRELLDSIITESNRLSNLTTNLLEMSRLEAGAASLRRSVLPAAEMIRNAVNRHRRIASGRKLDFAAPREEVLIEVDAVLFDLVLTNVMQNAFRYSPPDGTIKVACAAEGPDCVITVTDSGIGIPPEDQEKVFERFYRVQRSDDVSRGSGLGLAIARSFVEASHGSVGITSPICDGRGTAVSIRLPLALSGLNQGELAAAAIGDDVE